MRVPFLVVFGASMIGGAGSGVAQCNPSWIGGAAIAGTDGTVERVIEWDPDGPGPATAVLVLSGSFTTAASSTVSNLAAWDPSTATWSAFAPSVGAVTALAVAPNGDLYVARGQAPTSSARIERWTGSGWASVGGPLYYGPATAMAVRPNGTLVAAFQTQFAGGIHEWNGTSWTELGSVANGFVVTFTVFTNGDLVASLYQSPTSFGVVRWNGTAWSSLLPAPNGIVSSLAELPNGDVVAGGSARGTLPPFTAFGTQAVRGLARWNGTSWVSFGGDTDGDVFTLQRMANGDLVAGGAFTTIGTVTTPRLSRWNGSGWQPVVSPIDNGPLASAVHAVCERSTGLVIGGSFRSVGGVPATHIAAQQGNTWASLVPGADGFDGSVLAIALLPGGGHIVGGAFTAVGATVARGVARWNGLTWAPLGSGTDDTVRTVVVAPNGDIVAGGDFTTAGGVPVDGIARWDGVAWHALPGSQVAAPVDALTVLPNGEIVAASAAGIARWNGSSWTALGAGIQATALATSTTGQLFAVGTFAVGPGATHAIATWTGTGWSLFPLPTFPAFASFVTMPDGSLVTLSTVPVGMTVTNQFVRWNGSSWSPYGTPVFLARALAATPDGDLLVSSGFGLLRWNGSAWITQPTTNGVVRAMARLPDGNLLAGGDFTMIGAQPAGRFARLTSTCPAAASAQGVGCTGPAGPLTLTATSLPWLGGTFRARTTGMPANSFGLAVTSDSPTTLPLSLVSPVAGAGCDGLLSALLSEVVLPNGGVAESGFGLPDLPLFVGLQLHHYVASLEFDAGGQLLSLTSTNRLQLTLGVF